MARLEELLKEVADTNLRAQLEGEVATLKTRTRFGLVYEKHLPETVIAGDIDGLRVGDHVRPREHADNGGDCRVTELNGDTAVVDSVNGGGRSEWQLSDLLMVRRFGDPANAGLEPLGATTRSEVRPYHAVINGENFHALQALTFALEGQVDCIYIDPPYNTGATDWKYNNRYVDSNDMYRHSKWLSFMEKRLKVARRLLKDDGILICTVDANELHHLGVLLEELFSASRRQLVSICINPSGASGEGLSRVEEYAFFCFLGDNGPVRTVDDMLISAPDPDSEVDPVATAEGLVWESLLRRGSGWYRATRRNLCYPILLDSAGTRILRAGEPFTGDDEGKRPSTVDGHPVAWPVRRDGRLGIWRVDGSRLNWLVEKGYAYVAERDDSRGTWAIKYLMSGTVAAIEAGAIQITGTGARGQVQGHLPTGLGRIAKTMWYRGRHNAGGSGGTQLLSALLGARDLFPFPKNVYAVRDCLDVSCGDRANALVVDFFAGSGTTLNAVCQLNARDGGNRRCILVTNNEVASERVRSLNTSGSYPGDPGFEKHGIFEAVTRPRCEAMITGRRTDGAIVEGSYLDGRSYGEGFDENVEFFRLDYLDGDKVELGQCFDSVHPMLWLAAGGTGTRPEVRPEAGFLIAPECGYAVLLKDDEFRAFERELAGHEEITHVFFVTDSEEAYAEMREKVGVGRETKMLYRDFLDHYRRMRI